VKAKHPSAQTRAEIMRWRASHPGLTCRQIGARFGVSGLTVHRVLLAQPADGLPPPDAPLKTFARAMPSPAARSGPRTSQRPPALL